MSQYCLELGMSKNSTYMPFPNNVIISANLSISKSSLSLLPYSWIVSITPTSQRHTEAVVTVSPLRFFLGITVSSAPYSILRIILSTADGPNSTIISPNLLPPTT